MKGIFIMLIILKGVIKLAERRMFSKSVIDSDRFMDMNPAAQVLYFHLSMNADDDGFILKPKAVMRMCGASNENMEELAAEGYIIDFESGVVLIRHWKVNNYIKPDRYKPSVCSEKELVRCDEKSVYQKSDEHTGDNNADPVPEAKTPMDTVEPEWNHSGTGMDTQDRVRVRDRDRVRDRVRDRDSEIDRDRVRNSDSEIYSDIDRVRDSDIHRETERDSTEYMPGFSGKAEPVCREPGHTSSSTDVDTRRAFDYQKLVDSFNGICLSLPKVTKLTRSRKRQIQSALRMLDCDAESFFRRIEASDFLTGRNGGWNGCSFDWILKPQNLVKICEGNYDNKQKTPPPKMEYGAAYDIEEFEMFNAYDDIMD